MQVNSRLYGGRCLSINGVCGKCLDWNCLTGGCRGRGLGVFCLTKLNIELLELVQWGGGSPLEKNTTDTFVFLPFFGIWEEQFICYSICIRSWDYLLRKSSLAQLLGISVLKCWCTVFCHPCTYPFSATGTSILGLSVWRRAGATLWTRLQTDATTTEFFGAMGRMVKKRRDPGSEAPWKLTKFCQSCKAILTQVVFLQVSLCTSVLSHSYCEISGNLRKSGKT